jgi:hypothetical protein
MESGLLRLAAFQSNTSEEATTPLKKGKKRNVRFATHGEEVFLDGERSVHSIKNYDGLSPSSSLLLQIVIFAAKKGSKFNTQNIVRMIEDATEKMSDAERFKFTKTVMLKLQHLYDRLRSTLETGKTVPVLLEGGRQCGAQLTSGALPILFRLWKFADIVLRSLPSKI